MIHTQFVKSNIFDEEGEFPVIHYFGKDVPEELKKYINCEVKTEVGRGIILGTEEHHGVLDNYFMIYYPAKDVWSYELINDNKFCKEIEKENNL